MLTKTKVYPSFFTTGETEEIMSELAETIPSSCTPTCFGVKANDTGLETIEPLPWTDMLLSIKQFIEDRLDIELDRAWLYSNLAKKKHGLVENLNDEQNLHTRSIVLIYFPAFTVVYRKKT